MRLTPQVKALLPQVLELNANGVVPASIAQELQVGTPLVRKILGSMVELVRQLEQETT